MSRAANGGQNTGVDGEIDGAWRMAMRRFGPSLVVLLGGIGITLLLTRLYADTEVARAREQFASWCEERQQILNRSIDSHIEALYGLRALFDSSQYVSPDEFDQYTTAAISRRDDVRSLGYVRLVTDAQRDAFEQQYTQILGRPFAILDLQSDRRLEPAARRPLYAALVYAQVRDSAAVGLDSRTIPALATAMNVAAKSNSPSAAIMAGGTLIPGDTRSFVQIYLPIFSRATRHAAPDRKELEGYVRLRFVLEEVTHRIAAQARAAGIEMRLLEAGPGVEAADVGDGEIIHGMSWHAVHTLEWRGGIAIADRMLSLQLRATEGFAGERLLPPWAVLLAGIVITLLGTFTTYYLTSSRLRTERMSRNLESEMRERRLSEQRTAQSEERYRVLVENSPDAILMIRDGIVTFVNRPTIELFRARSAEELIGRDAVERVHPDFRAIAQGRIERMARERIILPAFEERLIRLDGTLVDVEVRSVPFVIDGATVLQTTIRDITARRQAERDRIGLETALRQSQRLEAIGTLTGGIAHDFNNILSSIVGNIRLVMDDLPQGHPARQSAHEIRNATNRARDLVKRLMTFSRQQEAPQMPLDLAPLVEEVQQLLRPALPAGVVLQSFVPPDTPPVIGDATQLHQVLVNLCTNAWQAMPSGRGEVQLTVSTLSAEEARRESRKDLQGATRYVRIEVRDNGNGIPAEIMDRIFDPFFTTKPAGEGSGLGLAVVHGIVQSHQGAIVAKSQPGDGSSFIVYLRASEQPARPVGDAAGDRPHGTNQHVLYVDDEEPLVILVTRILERNGYRCSATTDPRQAIEWVDKDPQSFDLVLTDMNMPGMSGIDVAREVLARRPTLPVVITTGYVRASDIAATRTLGIRDLILKPDTIDELANLVGRYLSQGR